MMRANVTSPDVLATDGDRRASDHDGRRRESRISHRRPASVSFVDDLLGARADDRGALRRDEPGGGERSLAYLFTPRPSNSSPRSGSCRRLADRPAAPDP
jgi:hypothetical protein